MVQRAGVVVVSRMRQGHRTPLPAPRWPSLEYAMSAPASGVSVCRCEYTSSRSRRGNRQVRDGSARLMTHRLDPSEPLALAAEHGRRPEHDAPLVERDHAPAAVAPDGHAREPVSSPDSVSASRRWTYTAMITPLHVPLVISWPSTSRSAAIRPVLYASATACSHALVETCPSITLPPPCKKDP